jgi:uncharacterized protein (TIGR02996 family)
MSDDQREALEARIADDPDDPVAWSVYADYLQKLGDPHGELAALQDAAELAPAGKPKTTAQRTFTRAFGKHASQILGTLVDHGADLKDPLKPPFVWKHGFVRRVIVGEAVDPTAYGARWVSAAATLNEILAHPAARMLGELEIRTPTDDDAAKVIAHLVRHAPRQLRELTIYARADLGDLSPLWDALPRLRRITVGARSFEVGDFELLDARRVELMPLSLTPATASAIAAAAWPVLERLEIRFGGQGLPPRATLKDLLPLFQRDDLPKLSVLKLRGCPYAGALLRAIADSPTAPQLVLLDVMEGNYNPHDLAYVAARKQAFSSLRELWAQSSTATLVNPAQALAGVAKHVVTRHVVDQLRQEMGTLEPSVLDRYRVQDDD